MGRRATLVRYYLQEMMQTRLVAAVLAVWVAVHVVAIPLGVRDVEQKDRDLAAQREAVKKFITGFPNYDFLFQNFLVVGRPTPALAALVDGSDYLAPAYVDYRARFSPTPYVGDDVDPAARMFKPFDLVTVVGLIGFLLAILLGHDAVNEEIRRKNYVLLAQFGVSLADIYVAKTVALLVVLVGSFCAVALVMAAGALAVLGPCSAEIATGAAGVFATSVLFLSLVVCFATALSTVLRHAGQALVFGVGFFVTVVYVTPFAVEHITSLGSHQSPYDLMEAKVNYTRLIHKQLDPPPDYIPPQTYDELKKLYMGWFVPGCVSFAIQASDHTMELDARFLDEQETKTRRAALASSWLSPFLAFATVSSIFSDTSVYNDMEYSREISLRFFKHYRDWYLPRFGRGLLFDTPKEQPLETWVFTPSPDPVEIDSLGLPQYPILSAGEKIALALPHLAALFVQLLAALLVGAAVSKRRVHVGEKL